MIIIFISFFSFIILLLINIYILIRNNKVADFKLMLLKKSAEALVKYLNFPNSDKKFNDYNFEKIYKLYKDINEISYDKMLFSFKPLIEDRWLTQEQSDFLEYSSEKHNIIG